MFRNHISLNTRLIPTNEVSKLKLDCVESKNNYILLIGVISFKLPLIKVCIPFLRHAVEICGILRIRSETVLFNLTFVSKATEAQSFEWAY